MKYFAAIAALLLASCSNDTEAPVEVHGNALSGSGPEAYEGAKLESRFKTNAPSGFKTDSEGNLVADTSKRSSFESSGRAAMGNREYNAKEFQPNEVRRPSFWGTKAYDNKSYAGATDGSRFHTQSRDSQSKAREGGLLSMFSRKKVETNTMGRKSALEEGASPMSRISDAETDVRRRKDVEPLIIDYQQQRAMEIQQTKSLLGN